MLYHDGGSVLRWGGSCCVCCGRMCLLLKAKCCSGNSEALKEVVSCTGSQVQALVPIHKVQESYPVGCPWGGKETDQGSCSHSRLDGCGAGLFPWKATEISAAQEWCWHTFSLGLPATAGNMWEWWIHFPFTVQLLVRRYLKSWLKWHFA